MFSNTASWKEVRREGFVNSFAFTLGINIGIKASNTINNRNFEEEQIGGKKEIRSEDKSED